MAGRCKKKNFNDTAFLKKREKNYSLIERHCMTSLHAFHKVIAYLTGNYMDNLPRFCFSLKVEINLE